MHRNLPSISPAGLRSCNYVSVIRAMTLSDIPQMVLKRGLATS